MSQSLERLGSAPIGVAIRDDVEQMLETARRSSRSLRDILTIKKYFVLSAPRTGSSLFCNALENSGLGWPSEWSHPLFIEQAKLSLQVPELDINDYYRR